MPDLQLPKWLAAILGPGLPATGWYLRTLFERHWAASDRKVTFAEGDLKEKLTLLRRLNGELYQKWLWLADHNDAASPELAAPAANLIGSWLYEHSSHFPERFRPALVKLADVTFLLATRFRPQVLKQYRAVYLPSLWEELRRYQREIENRLGA